MKNYTDVLAQGECFTDVNPDPQLGDDQCPLAGQPVAVDDNIYVKGMKSTAGSALLTDFEPPFSATAVKRTIDAGAFVAGKTRISEFGLGFGYSGSAKVVGTNVVPLALSADVNGYARRSAALENIYFIKPTYGVVSRTGLIGAASSMDQIGVMSSNIYKGLDLLNAIAGRDHSDPTTYITPRYDFKVVAAPVGLKIAIPTQYIEDIHQSVKNSLDVFINRLSEQGASVTTIDVPQLKLAHVAANIISCAETCSNLSRFDGIKFGYRDKNCDTLDQLVVNSRAFSTHVKKVILFGSYVLSKENYESHYVKALKTRRLLRNMADLLFGEYDLLIVPTLSDLSKDYTDISSQQMFNQSMYTAFASLLGLPCLVVPGGLQVIANTLGENTMFRVIDERA